MSKKEAVLGLILVRIKGGLGGLLYKEDICSHFYKYAVLESGTVCEKNLPISNDMC